MSVLIDNYPTSNQDSEVSLGATSVYAVSRYFKNGVAPMRMHSCDFLLRKAVTLVGKIRAILFMDDQYDGGIPLQILSYSDWMTANNLGTSLALTKFNFTESNMVALAPLGRYQVGLELSNENDTVYVGSDSSSPTYPGWSFYEDDSYQWHTYPSDDLICYVYGESSLETVDSYPISMFDGKSWIGGGTTGDDGTGASQSFTSGIITRPISHVGWLFECYNNPTGVAYAKIYEHSGVFGTSSLPTGSPIAVSNAVDIAGCSEPFNIIMFPFSGDNEITLNPLKHYVCTLEYTATNGDVACIRVIQDNSSSTHSGNMGLYNGSWNYYPSDFIFFVVQKAAETLVLVEGYPESNYNEDGYLAGDIPERSNSFIMNGQGGILHSCQWYLKKFGDPAGNLRARLYSRNTGEPVSLLATSDEINMSALTASMQLVTFTFSNFNKVVLSPGAEYHIDVDSDLIDWDNGVYVGGDNTPTQVGMSGNPVYSYIQEPVGWANWDYAGSYNHVFYIYAEPLIEIVDSYPIGSEDGVTFLSSDYNSQMGQSFTSKANCKPLSAVACLLSSQGTLAGTMVSKIYTHTGTFGVNGIPDTLVATSDTVNVSAVTDHGDYIKRLVPFIFSDANRVILTPQQHYFAVIEYTGGGGSNTILVHEINTNPSHSGNVAYGTVGYSWYSDNTRDFCFYVFQDNPIKSVARKALELGIFDNRF
jgi:hypothetical protein